VIGFSELFPQKLINLLGSRHRRPTHLESTRTIHLDGRYRRLIVQASKQRRRRQGAVATVEATKAKAKEAGPQELRHKQGSGVFNSSMERPI
jgi:hypothetical protein